MEKIEFSLVIAQAVILGLSQLIYALQKSALNVEKRDRGMFAPQVTEALRVSTEAKQIVEALNTQKYESVRNDLLECCKENAKLSAKCNGLEESIANLSNKLASRDRADAMAMRRAAARGHKLEDDEETPAPAAPTPTAPRTLEEAIAAGIALPLHPPPAPEAAANQIPFGFGKRAQVR